MDEATRSEVRARIEDLMAWIDMPDIAASCIQDLANTLGLRWSPPRDFASEWRQRQESTGLEPPRPHTRLDFVRPQPDGSLRCQCGTDWIPRGGTVDDHERSANEHLHLECAAQEQYEAAHPWTHWNQRCLICLHPQRWHKREGRLAGSPIRCGAPHDSCDCDGTTSALARMASNRGGDEEPASLIDVRDRHPVFAQRLARLFEPSAISEWLESGNSALQGARPIDILRAGRLDDFDEAVRSEERHAHE